MKISESDYAEIMRKRGGANNLALPLPAKKSKYNASKTKMDGITFDSKLEAAYYAHLLILQKCREVKYFHRQVIFDLGGGTTYRCDFQVIYKNGEVSYIDIKGYETQAFKRSKKQVEAKYGIDIVLVKKGEF